MPESLEGSSNNRRQHPPLLPVSRVQTFPFSLHLSKHVALFSGMVSRGLPAFFRTPGNPPGKVFLHPQNVKLTFPQSDFFWQPWHSCSQLIIDAHVGRKKWTFFFRSLLLIVQFYCCFKPAAVLSEVQEFQPSPTLFSKSYYPRWSPAASGILYKLCQLTSVPSPLHEEFSALQRSGQFFLISSQKIRTWREQDERNNSKDFDLDSRRPETLKLTRIYTICPLMAAGQRWFLDVWEGQLTSWRCRGR